MPDTQIYCPSCGVGLPSNARFCSDCGSSISPPADAPEMQSMPGALATVSGLETEPMNGSGQGFQAAQDALRPGEVVAGKYTIERMIGRGGMGAVYLATEADSNEQVALKVISSSKLRDEKAVDRLIQEGRLTRKLRHPNIVSIYDIGRHNGQPFIAMEYIKGDPLHVWRSAKTANGEPVSTRVAARIVKEILDGLEIAHKEGVVHRDLKPENIMLIGEPTDMEARIKIVDFGIALETLGGTGSGTGSSGATPAYMAPEQLRNANNANETADLYAISKIFYELIVGVLPMGHWQPPSSGRSDVPAGIDALIETGLSANRDNRPQSVEQYRDWLVRAMNNQPVPGPVVKTAEKVPGKPATPGNMSPLKIGGLIAGGAAALVLIIALGSMNWDGSGQTTTGGITTTSASAQISAWSGRWADGFGGYYDLRVANSGRVSGSGALSDGTRVSVRGTMYPGVMEYTLLSDGKTFAEGVAQQTDECHFTFVLTSFNGQNATGTFHIGHNPGAPCP